MQRPIAGLVVHQVRVVDGEFTAGARCCTRAVDPEWRTRRPPGALAAPTSCTPRCARCSAPPRCSPAPTTGPATCASTSAGPPALSPEQVRDVEQVSNQALRADLPVGRAVHDAAAGPGVGRDRALRRDLRQRKVRVVEIGGPWSRELCGGTHVEPLLADRHRRASPASPRSARATAASRRSPASRASATSPASATSSPS